MVYAPRKMVFPFFIVIFAIVFFTLLYFSFLYQPLRIGSGATFSIIGDKVVLKMDIVNVSNERVNNISVIVKSNSGSKTFYLGNAVGSSYLDKNQLYSFVGELPLSDDRDYTVSVSAPFMRSLALNFSMAEETINPIDASVEEWVSKPIIGTTYTFPVKVCNLAKNQLNSVAWGWGSDDGFFKEEPIERSVSLDVSGCKSFYFTLTPIRTGTANGYFYWRVGEMERRKDWSVTISE
jgi:hypothetical protein